MLVHVVQCEKVLQHSHLCTHHWKMQPYVLDHTFIQYVLRTLPWNTCHCLCIPATTIIRTIMWFTILINNAEMPCTRMRQSIYAISLCHLLFTNMLERDGHTMNVHVLQSRTIVKFKKLYWAKRVLVCAEQQSNIIWNESHLSIWVTNPHEAVIKHRPIYTN